MPALPSSSSSLLIRTAFADVAAWNRVAAEAQAGNVDGFRAELQLIDDPVWGNCPWEELRDASHAAGSEARVLFVVDRQALAPEHPILVVDLSEEENPPFRCVASQLWGVENNLHLANMDWIDFAQHTDADGTFRDFP